MRNLNLSCDVDLYTKYIYLDPAWSMVSILLLCSMLMLATSNPCARLVRTLYLITDRGPGVVLASCPAEENIHGLFRIVFASK